MSKISRFMSAAEWRLFRWKKYRRQKRMFDQKEPKTTTFLFGCQKSGTTITVRTLGKSLDVWDNNHEKFDPIFGFGTNPSYVPPTLMHLAPAEELQKIINGSYARNVVFHAIEESQNADRWLESIDNAQAVWIFRRYQDVANSAVGRWGDHQKDLMRRFRDHEYPGEDWRGENVPDDVRELIVSLYRDDMSSEDGAAMFWYLRNQFYWRFGFDDDARVLLVKYEDLVTNPQEHFPPLFEFVGVPFQPEHVAHIFSSSVGKRPFKGVRRDIEELCEELWQKFETRYQEAKECVV